ncbi:hypothetical protein HQ563_07235 [bacterium]|nr:hypothetical protein [bacterium]
MNSVRPFQSLAFGPDDDPDSDGLTTSQELKDGSDPAKSDTDGDGESDGQEVIAGTDPLDAQSCLKITMFEPGDVETRLWWNAVPGKEYRVFASENLTDWTCVREALIAHGTTGLFVEKHNPLFRKRFLRVEVLP